MKDKILYYVVGSQHLYGEETLKQVAEHAQEMARFLDSQEDNPVTIKYFDTVKTPQEVTDMCQKVNFDPQCVGIIAWMHTFSPAKMWINGLKILNKPMLHLNTQYNEKIPYDSIDMDFMNLNQSAHGDREFGHIVTRLRIRRKVVAGYYKDPNVLKQIFAFARAAAAAEKSKTLKVARFGDNMREVAVTEGDKVEAQTKLGWSINGYGLGDLVEYIDKVSQKEIDELIETYKEKYAFQKDMDLEAVKTQAKYQIALERFLQDGCFNAFTTTFENLHGLKQLPGLACQVLMEQGYGFGAEGDWKTAALTHLIKYMATGLEGGSSFMEDYTYHLEKGKQAILGAHMLEVCPTIAEGKPSLEVHPLGIGGKEPPARLVFEGKTGDAMLITLVDMGDRFRMIVNKARIIKSQAMPKLPVARVLWQPLPDMTTSAQAWILAGGAHHSVLTTQLELEHIQDFARIMDIELIVIDQNTEINRFENELMISDLVWKSKN
ncbi:MAG TPA: L-arabinose isomerase [Clostridiales bacterium]|jgi:L-arabinose isomerase|nr:L-arabinose isomerase [Clostridiales bacterium]